MIWNIILSENVANVNVTLKNSRTKLLYDFDIALTIIASNKICIHTTTFIAKLSFILKHPFLLNILIA